MLAVIGFSQLKIECIIGTYEFERNEIQVLFIDLEVETDIKEAAMSDSLDKALDYVSLAEICSTVARQGRYHLLETYCYIVASRILTTYPFIRWVMIKVKKPQAIAAAECVFVELKVFQEDRK